MQKSPQIPKGLSRWIMKIRHQNWQFLREICLVSSPFGLVLSSFLILWHCSEYQREISLIQRIEQKRVEIAFLLLEHEFKMIAADLLILSEDHNLQKFLVSASDRDRQILEQEYLVFSKYKTIYDQVRFLDARGQEQVRVNFNQGHPTVVPQVDLQDKGQRYYFRDTYQLKAGEMFVSPLDLNIENQVIELPFKPMIRFGTPVYQTANQPAGIVLLNYQAGILLQRLKNVLQSSVNQPMLLNAAGYWLMAPNPEDEWGFMLEHEQRTFAHVYPELWPILQQQAQGQIHTNAGIFTFRSFYPLIASMISSTGSAHATGTSQRLANPDQYMWKIVAWVPNSVVSQLQQRHLGHVLKQGVLLWGGLLLIGALVARARIDNRRHLAALKTSERRLRAITSELANGLLVVDQGDRLVLMNPEAERLLGWPEAKLLGQKIHHLIHRSPGGTPIPVETCGVLTALREGKTIRVQRDRFTRADGSTMMVSYSASPIWESGQVTGAVVDFHDVTQECQEHEHLSQLAIRDPLTGVFNRRELERQIVQMIHEAQENHSTFALLIFDIDHFKHINDTYGHLVGDQILQQLTRLATQTLRANDVIARYGGEEFVALLPQIQTPQAYCIAERLRKSIMNCPFAVDPTGPDSTGPDSTGPDSNENHSNENSPHAGNPSAVGIRELRFRESKSREMSSGEINSREINSGEINSGEERVSGMLRVSELGSWAGPQPPAIQVTVSVGGAVYPDQGDRPETLIEFADQMLYRAKKSGRNAVKMTSNNDQPVQDMDCPESC
jgi:diguanylate cyclase (GGDEF)-like protein/PAS domain S-box-containing protein